MSGAVRFTPVLWPAVADEFGFAANARGEWVRNGSALRHEGGWLALAQREPLPGDPLRDLLGTHAVVVHVLVGEKREVRERGNAPADQVADARLRCARDRPGPGLVDAHRERDVRNAARDFEAGLRERR